VYDISYTHTLLLVISGFTMLTGVLGAVAQNDFRRILAFHSVSQIGYIVMGLGLFTPLALAGSIFFILHHSLVKSNLFLVSGVANRLEGSYELKKLGGLYHAYPGLSLLFLVPAFSLAGVPPLSGFFAKLVLVRAGLDIEQYAIVAVALGVSLLTLFSMTKIWAEAFWKPTPGPEPAARRSYERRERVLLGPIILLAAAAVLLGVGFEPVLNLALRAAEQLATPAEYIGAVLGART
jgi:multicomponent Na+:H+ antiporter subunit D